MAPTAAAAGSPSLNRISVGIDITPKRWATAGCSSMFSFTIFRSSRSSAIWSSTGAIAWHGPHHSAQKSRSEEHTSELQSPCNLVCRLLLEKKKINHTTAIKRLHNSHRHSFPYHSYYSHRFIPCIHNYFYQQSNHAFDSPLCT